jgi:transcriptional regulator with XRE-family HTH domain
MEYFSTNLIFLREKSKKTQKDISLELGFKNPSRLNNYEKGNSKPELEVLIKLSEKFSVTIDDLLNTDLSNSNELNNGSLVKEPPGEYHTKSSNQATDKDMLIETQAKLIKSLEEQLRLTKIALAAAQEVRKAG